ncbi:GNAT family N-acetyltransferase [Streptosporangium lutulentum]|uniref:GNAT superfamily N-acetyltransferase n=1 Tax=Streptosporangium lutulentum TaxID=1461250 RepID=A0ABT9QJY5_9ACTN|nr:GNAT family N-acetyltransferase [Streptosporangium lutulentum]MDP9847027.1 GNAT superfamily N-acetyltransferase [Streptosporangium lutulentum]
MADGLRIGIRRYEKTDHDAVMALAPRLAEGGAAWRDSVAVADAACGWVRDSVRRAEGDKAAVFVAEDADGVVGFVGVTERAHFTGETDGYIGELVVARDKERLGVGRALIEAAESWVKDRGHARSTLETGAANTNARDFYAALGYSEEEVRLSRAL